MVTYQMYARHVNRFHSRYYNDLDVKEWTTLFNN